MMFFNCSNGRQRDIESNMLVEADTATTNTEHIKKTLFLGAVILLSEGASTLFILYASLPMKIVMPMAFNLLAGCAALGILGYCPDYSDCSPGPDYVPF